MSCFALQLSSFHGHTHVRYSCQHSKHIEIQLRNSSNMDNALRLKPVTKNDYRFLFDLLSQRDPRANISHRKMPTYQQHVRFVRSKPYAKWYTINYNNERIGSIYLTHMSEIGISLTKEFHKKGIGTKALKLIMRLNPRDRFLANISPLNKKSIKFFTKNRFELIQYTYELRIKNLDK